MAKNKAKYKLKKNLERYVDELITDSTTFGLQFKDPIINTRSRSVSASGELRGAGDAYIVGKFNKKGNKLEELVFTLEYDEVNATLVQEFKYSNFKKFEKSSEGSHEKRYETITDLLSNEKTMQRGVDLYERMPGVSDVNVYLNNYETYESFNWM